MAVEVQLVKPTIDLKEGYLQGLVEFQAENLSWVMDIDVDDLRKRFGDFVLRELNKKTEWTKDTPVDETELWATVDGVYAGRISIRHRLNQDLRVMGGHIGYDVRPQFRGRGVATAMLKQALPIAKRLGITKALLTCNDVNAASIKVIERNGGILEKAVMQEGGPLKRYYWIAL